MVLDMKIKAAAVHATPVFMDKAATLQKVVAMISQAAEQSVQLLVFPEVFVPGFPYFINCYAPGKQVPAIQKYTAESVVVPDDLGDVQRACARHKVTISLGISERMKGGYTCFNSIVTIDADGTILGVHRKLKPTYAERYVWAEGSGHTLCVYDTSLGVKLGGLACWEHTFNGARQALLEQREHIHAGCWPAIDGTEGFRETCSPQIEALMKTHALTAQVFVICATGFVDEATMKWMEDNLGPQDHMIPGKGWSAIIHPMCAIMAGPVSGSEDQLVVAELDMAEIGSCKVYIDGMGHYKRPDILKSSFDSRPVWPDDEFIRGPIPLPE
ncbi:carbon-nitrogen hydrolase [Thozetella sp. PMI_491]|nr:carbon-nitrogen hydrolase [Thozetella sp. PMI_491]